MKQPDTSTQDATFGYGCKPDAPNDLAQGYWDEIDAATDEMYPASDSSAKY